MALEHLVLGLVAGGVRHGYAIWRHVDDALGGRGTVQRSHVYAALATLERRRLVVAGEVPATGRAGRRAFDATAAGGTWLRAWLDRAPRDATLVVQRALFVKLAVRALLGERPSRREVAAERAARHAIPDRAVASRPLLCLLRERARRHAEAELWLLERLEAAGLPPATRARSGSASR